MSSGPRPSRRVFSDKTVSRISSVRNFERQFLAAAVFVVDRVNEIMDLYRQAAERFEAAGDVRHEEVVTHMRKFLALSLTASILDGSYQKPDDEKLSVKGEGVVLQRVRSDDAEDGGDKEFQDNMDNILKEAEADLAQIQVEDDPELEAMGDSKDDEEESDPVADFENMLKEADDELAQLMAS